MYEVRKNTRKVHQINIPIHKSASKDSNIACNLYLRDYYLKDFKYISPEILQVKNKATEINPLKVSEGVSCRFFVRRWLREVMEGLRQFLYQGSLHGVKYIFEPTFSRKERVTWIIIMFISIAMCIGIIIQLFCKSTSTPFVNIIDSLPTPIWSIPFPSVVLCPHMHVQLSYANVSESDDLRQFFASRICPQMFSDNKCLKHRMTVEQNIMLLQFIVQGSPKCTDIIKTCSWRGPNDQTKWESNECCDNFFKPLFTNYGLCYAFNSLPLNGMTNVTLPWQKSFDKHAAPGTLQWGLDSGYPKIFPPNLTTPPFRVMASGESNGLGLELFLNSSEHQFVCEGSSRGFNLLISSPTDHVYTSTVLRLPMNRMTTIEVYPVTYKTDSNLRPLSPERRQCFFQNERKLVHYEFYTDSNCKHDLLVLEAVKSCHCVLYNWPRKGIEEPICSTTLDFKCIDVVKANVEKQLIDAYFADSEEERPSRVQSTSCHPSCNDVLYSSQVFYSDLITEPGDATPESGHEGDTTRINVHFYDDMFLGQHRHVQYDDYYFVGAIGGLLSLFLGFSIISVAELVYFVLLRPLHIVLREILCAG